MNELVRLYDYNQFAVQLKKVRIYKGIKHQSAVCSKLGISRQVYSLWELDRRQPTIRQLTKIANFFQVDINCFLLQDANPIEYDLSKPLNNLTE